MLILIHSLKLQTFLGDTEKSFVLTFSQKEKPTRVIPLSDKTKRLGESQKNKIWLRWFRFYFFYFFIFSRGPPEEVGGWQLFVKAPNKIAERKWNKKGGVWAKMKTNGVCRPFLPWGVPCKMFKVNDRCTSCCGETVMAYIVPRRPMSSIA